MTVSAPYLMLIRSFSSSPSTFDVTAELPMFALILQREAMPIAIGSRFGWLILAGMTIRPRATSDRTSSGSSPSALATWLISPVTMPLRA